MQRSREMRAMLFCKCICAWQPVQVVHGDGHIRSLSRPLTVGELLECHPHHFVCEPTANGPLYHSGMLPVDMELEEGRIYLLLPLPRLLPHLATSFPSTPCCPCFHSHMPGNQKPVENQSTKLRSWVGNRQQVAVHTMRKVKQKVVKSRVLKSAVRISTRMCPERLRFRFSFHKLLDSSSAAAESNNNNNNNVSSSELSKMQGSCKNSKQQQQQYCPRNRWRPGLECISEVDQLLTSLLKLDSSELSLYR